ncbi:MAG TPA: glyceraldehyde 3-phosphate dehydrogenase NAD-binding domain-containing protein [Candidatus Paceibacterota bacterium]|nr:glyceraldehyde 3-phosphate dehydrogenase NAD-binding domain-containing protein [Candidatus Paceibacterota bacterium]
MSKLRVAINGFGRIGRQFIRQSFGREDLEVVAVNDLGSLENLAYLLTYDTVYRRAPFSVSIDGDSLVLDGKKIRFISEKDPAALPWKEMNIDVVIESTGLFTEFEKAKAHLDAGARRVVISAPGKGDESLGATVLMGINEGKMGTCPVTSNGSCTTNAASPVVAILEEKLGIEKALLDTIHSYTASQSIVDGPNKKDWREGRAAAQNLVPSSTGAAISVTKAVEGVPFFDGISVRVPTVVGSYVDLTFVTKKHTNKDEVNQILRDAAKEARWQGIFRATDEPLVSSDIIGDLHASIADLQMTRVVGGNLVKVLSWYDNEAGYTSTLIQHVIKAGNA